jgi:hypothetical protein
VRAKGEKQCEPRVRSSASQGERYTAPRPGPGGSVAYSKFKTHPLRRSLTLSLTPQPSFSSLDHTRAADVADVNTSSCCHPPAPPRPRWHVSWATEACLPCHVSRWRGQRLGGRRRSSSGESCPPRQGSVQRRQGPPRGDSRRQCWRCVACSGCYCLAGRRSQRRSYGPKQHYGGRSTHAVT